MKTFKEILEILYKSGYLKYHLKKKEIMNIEFMPLGLVLLQNIQSEMNKNKSDINIYFGACNKNSNAIQPYENPVDFIKTSNFKENFLFLKDKFQKHLPFAIKTFLYLESFQLENTNFNLSKRNIMMCDYFFPEKLASEKFSKIQRERKIWWMKFSVDPGRFYFSDFKTELIKKNKLQSVKIKAKYNFGEIELENIYIIPIKMFNLDNLRDFYFVDTKLNKKVLPVIIHSEVCVDTAAIAILLDALENSKNEKLHLQRNIAPYQCSIFCLYEDEKVNADLKDLAIHLSNILRTSNIRTLQLDKCYVKDIKSLQKELTKIDKIGVPYSIIINSVSLQNGIIKFRCRDTTIFEEIHISDVPHNLINIFNSF